MITGQISVAQKRSASSAYCPPPRRVAVASAAIPSALIASARVGAQALASPNSPDTHTGTTECGSGTGPSTSTRAPVAALMSATSVVSESSQVWL